MAYRYFIITFYFLLGILQARGQPLTIVVFKLNADIVATKGIRFSIYSPTDTLILLDYANKKYQGLSNATFSDTIDTIFGVFEYSKDFKEWQKIEYPISIDKNLKRIEIHIIFSKNIKNLEFLKDLTVNKFYTTNGVSIHPTFKVQIGEKPMFMIVNNCDTTFWGCGSANHFYETEKTQRDYALDNSQRLYCPLTIPNKPFKKSDTVYGTCVSNFSNGDEYIIKKNGTYRFNAVLGLNKYSDEIQTKLINRGQTRMRTRIFYEIESEIFVE